MRKMAFALAFAACLLGMAQEKVAYVNIEKSFAEFYKTSNANVIFEQKKLDYDEKMSTLADELEAATGELKALEGDAKNELLSKEARDEARRKLKIRADLFNGKREGFERERRAGVQELNKLKAETEETLVNELRGAIRKFAADNGYTLVYDISGMTMNRMPVLLVYPEQLEITAAFIKFINEGHDKELADAKAKLEAMKASRNSK